MKAAMKAVRVLALLLLRAYQILLSPLLAALFPGYGCRFTPSCSEYARQSIHRHGLLRGGGLTLRRLGRCHPFHPHPGGHDPPPV